MTKKLASKVVTQWVSSSIINCTYYLQVFSVLSIRKNTVRMRKIEKKAVWLFSLSEQGLWKIVNF